MFLFFANLCKIVIGEFFEAKTSLSKKLQKQRINCPETIIFHSLTHFILFSNKNEQIRLYFESVFIAM